GANIRKTETLPPVDRAAASAASLARQLEVLQRLIQGAPAEQAEILAASKHAYDTAPTPSNELAYALVLATPGHPGFDAPHAEQLLREALATPETLLQAERSAGDGERSAAALDRKLQGEQEENAKLRKELEEAQTKLDAIANIERSLNARKGRTEGSPK